MTRDPAYRKRIGYQAGLLGGFTLLAAALLVMGNQATEEAIAQRRLEDRLASLAQVMPADRYDNDLLQSTLELTAADGRTVLVYQALRDLQVVGLVFEVVGQGYAGDIRLLLALDPAGRVINTRVLAHAETPGLGDKIEVNRDDWILDFNGKSLGEPPVAAWAVRKDGGVFDQFSGATITPRAVVRAVREGLEFFAEHRDALLAAPVMQSAPLTQTAMGENG